MFRVFGRLKEIKVKKEDIKKHLKITGDVIVEPIIADESKEIKKGDIIPIKIRKIKIPPKSVIILCPYALNRHGHVLAVGEEIPLPIDVERCVDLATFVCVLDGEIKEGDVLGTLLISSGDIKE
ncbi:DUF22 domain-containing protein [Methanocaldococcus indicus]|uniref:DUF22 domain-containing protein n=1 Tax=Methanocaldococcus indicus TaxID=213231 RepID=UPI003C6CCF4C